MSDTRSKMQTIMDAFLHQAALHSFKRFLSDLDISEEEYEQIKKLWREKLGVEPYI
jgi:hypothetical protein